MAFWQFTGSVTEYFPTIGLNAKPGYVYDFGSITPPAEPSVREGLSPAVASNWTQVSGPATDFLLDQRQVSDLPGLVLGVDRTGTQSAVAAINAAIAAASAGDVIRLPAGVLKIDAPIVAASGIHLMGQGTTTAGASLGTQLNVTIVGASAAINAAGVTGFRMSGVALVASSASFTGALVDLTNSALSDLYQCYLQATSTADLLHLDRATHHMSSKCNFVNGNVQVLGKALQTSFSNAHIFNECRFGGATTAAIKNAGQAWQVIGGASEPGAAGIANFYRHDAGVRGENVSIKGTWFGDITANGPNSTITWSGDNLSIRDCYCGFNDGAFVTVNENGCNGLVLDNNQYNAFNTHNPTYAVDFGATSGHSGFQFTNSKVFTPLTSNINGVLPADTCLTLKPTPLDFGFTFDPRVGTYNNGTITANRTVYLRYRGSNGPITAIALVIGVASGNIAVSVYRNTGTGRSARPGARIGTSGSIACPVAGYQEVALTASADIRDGDWLAIAADNATASFGLAGPNGLGFATARGLSHFEGVYPPPATASPSGTDAVYSFILVAVP